MRRNGYMCKINSGYHTSKKRTRPEHFEKAVILRAGMIQLITHKYHADLKFCIHDPRCRNVRKGEKIATPLHR